MPRLVQTDATTEAALAAAVSRLGWCEALSAALGDAYRVVWRTSGGDAVVTCAMTGSLPVSEQTCRVSAQPASVTCASGTPTQTLLESADGERWAKLDRMVPLVDSQGAALAPVAGAGFTWVQPLVVMPPAGLSRLPAWLQDAPLLTWHEIGGTTLKDYAASLGLTSTEAGNLTAFSSGAWNGADFYIHGGGHGDIAGNGVYRLRLSTDTPEYSVTVTARPAGTRDALTTDDGYYYPVVGGVEEPVESHTYWNCYIDTARNRFMRLSCGGAGTELDGRAQTVDGADLSTGAWDGKGAYPDNLISSDALSGYPAAYDSERRRIWIASAISGSGRLVYFDLLTLSWTDLGAVAGSTMNDVPLVYDPVRKRLFRPRTLNSSTTAQTLDIGDTYSSGMPAATSRTLTAVGGADLSQVRSGCSMTYCADRDSYLSLKWATRSLVVHETDPDTFEVSVMAVAGTLPTLPSSLGGDEYYYYRWQYVDALGGVFFMPRSDGNCFFLRTR